MSGARLSAIVPVFNGAEFVADAVESIRAQTIAPDEIIVVDDASTDGSGDRAAAFSAEVQVVSHERNGGLPVARNTGIDESTGELIAFLDVDDLWEPEKTARQVALLDSDAGADMVLGRTRRMRSLESRDGQRRFEPWGQAETMLSMGSGLFRRSAFDRVGPLDASLPFTCDWDWFMRARELGLHLRVHTDVVQYYRRHDANLTEDTATGNQQTLAMLSKSLQRRREAAGRAASLPDLDWDNSP